MRHLVLIIALFLTISFAQDETSSKWSMYAGVTSMGVEDGDNRLIGRSFGVAYAVNKNMTIGMGYSGRGATVEFDRYGSQYSFKELHILGLVKSREAEVQANAIEFWSAFTLVDKWGFSLWTGPIYAHIYSYDIMISEGGMYKTNPTYDVAYSEDGAEDDYGLMFGASFPLQNKLNLNVGYYYGLKEDPNPKFNNLFLELGYQF
tara:strand:+ start:57 stop:668 length:612 start_codon:yes stop_codon:yes gene_type:complete